MLDGADLRPETTLPLPERLRAALSEPWGPVVDTATLALMLRPDDIVLAVGDIVSITLQDLGIVPHVFICDFKTQRQEDDPELHRRLGTWGDHAIHVHNPAGELTREAWDAVREGVQRPGSTRITVDGEEDLLGLPCFLEAPDGAFVLYGMPNQGIVVCRVDAALQHKVAAFVAQMA